MDPFISTERYKMVLLGEADTGKTCFLHRLVIGSFDEQHPPSVGASFHRFAFPAPKSNYQLLFDIWDTAGQERYQSLAPMYYRGAAVILVTYDITSPSSFERAKGWVERVQDCSANAGHAIPTLVILVGCKLDLESDGGRMVSESTARQFADETGVSFVETSAKTGQNVTLVMEIAATYLSNCRPKPKCGPHSSFYSTSSSSASSSLSTLPTPLENASRRLQPKRGTKRGVVFLKEVPPSELERQNRSGTTANRGLYTCC